MTNRRVAAGVLAMLLMAGVNNAEAQRGGWRAWLDKLSGPGEFRGGVQASIQIGCYGVPGRLKLTRPNTTDADFDDTENPKLKRSWGGIDIGCRDKWDYVDVGKTGQHIDLWRVAFGLEIGQSTAAHNPLKYEGIATGDGPKVTLVTLVPTVDFVPNDWLEVGAGGGLGWFTTAGFGTAGKLLIQPFRVSVKPLALLTSGRKSRSRAAGFIVVNFNLTTFPGGFDAGDFGAIPASWQVGTEALRSFSLVLDFGALFRR